MTDRELMDMAREAAGKAYVPYSQFPVGAALECSDGTVFTGCNVENAALGSTICAERTAACKAVSEGHTDFVRIAIWGEGKNWCMPCGACRELMAQMCEGAGSIEILSDYEAQKAVRLEALLPRWWGEARQAAEKNQGECRRP